MAALIRHLTSEYDLVVMDTPPATLISDVIPLLTLVSGVLVVGEPGRTTRESAAALREQLGSLDAPVLGVVANNVRTRSVYGYYHREGLTGVRIGGQSGRALAKRVAGRAAALSPGALVVYQRFQRRRVLPQHAGPHRSGRAPDRTHGGGSRSRRHLSPASPRFSA